MNSPSLFSEDIILSVGTVSTLLKQTIEGSFYGLSIEGEISNFRPSSTGHWYFTLQDEQAAISAVLFKHTAWRIPFMPKNGDKVVVTGSLSVYEKRGTYQIICTAMKKTGQGDILALLEERKRIFAQAGYFSDERKRPLPAHPKRVGIVTSPTGAALQDILQVLNRRNASLDVLILPTPVQGEDAAPIIAARINQASRFLLCDVLIVTRGGGSIEDLLPFSEQSVIEAIVESEIPVISAVGHEIDWALSDYAADLRAPTPSAAAELVSAEYEEVVQKNIRIKQSIVDTMQQKLVRARLEKKHFDNFVLRERIERQLDQERLRLDDYIKTIGEIMLSKQKTLRHALQLMQSELHGQSPLAILQRGYAIITDRKTGKRIKGTPKPSAGDILDIRVSDGSFAATVIQEEGEHA